jgi:hypothetical protein
MAEVQGFLREDATHGERVVLKNLKNNLPRDFTVYVEYPLQHRRMQRFPDFIVVTNYGVLVLEVKDWVEILKADRYQVRIRSRGNQERDEKNPVFTARDYALALQENLKEIPELVNEKQQLEVPWGYGVVFPNLGTAATSHLRVALGENLVMGQGDIGPDIILKRLREMIPEGRAAALSGEQLRHIRAVINPTVLIEPEDRPAIILDEVQEKLVVEPVAEEVEEAQASGETQLTLVEEEAPREIEMLPEEQALAERLGVRLVRGVAGSGKSLVLIQRAKFLSAAYPDWRLLVMTFNTALNDRLEAELRGFSNVRVANFHKVCREITEQYRQWNPDNHFGAWLRKHGREFDIVNTLSRAFVEAEIQWILETGLEGRESYMNAPRRGRGNQERVSQLQRSLIYSVLEAFRRHQAESDALDWLEVPGVALSGIASGKVEPEKYDAILIDEAQDFAPSWFQLILQLVKPRKTSIFIADDPTQSIYRFFSWKEKGIPVVGRTRWLRVPYRNTRQIYHAAYSVIERNQMLQDLLKQEGELVIPDVDHPFMRDGQKPLVRRYESRENEVHTTADSVRALIQAGVPAAQIAVLNPQNRNLEAYENAIHEPGVSIGTYQRYKGLEFKAVFLTQIQDLFRGDPGEEQLSHLLRLAYMGMTRAREELTISYEHGLPEALKPLLEFCDHIA